VIWLRKRQGRVKATLDFPNVRGREPSSELALQSMNLGSVEAFTILCRNRRKESEPILNMAPFNT
jgi:hypothetical protein